MLRNRPLHRLDGGPPLVVGTQLPQTMLSHGERNGAPDNGCVRYQLDQCTFQLPDIGSCLRRDQNADIIGQSHAFRLGFLVEDRHFGLEVRRLDIDHQAPFEARAETLDETRDVLGGTIARDDDLLLGVMTYAANRIPEISDNIYSIDKLVCRDYNIDYRIIIV